MDICQGRQNAILEFPLFGSNEPIIKKLVCTCMAVDNIRKQVFLVKQKTYKYSICTITTTGKEFKIIKYFSKGRVVKDIVVNQLTQRIYINKNNIVICCSYDFKSMRMVEGLDDTTMFTLDPIANVIYFAKWDRTIYKKDLSQKRSVSVKFKKIGGSSTKAIIYHDTNVYAVLRNRIWVFSTINKEQMSMKLDPNKYQLDPHSVVCLVA